VVDQQQRRDQEAGQDEEHVDAQEPAAQVVLVEHHHRDHRERPEAVERGTVCETLGNPATRVHAEPPRTCPAERGRPPFSLERELCAPQQPGTAGPFNPPSTRVGDPDRVA
jgi:hypothetical protein